MVRSARCCHQCRRSTACAFPAGTHGGCDAAFGWLSAVFADNGIRQHDSAESRSQDARRSEHGMAYPLPNPLECDGDGRARESQTRRTGRAHCELRVERHVVRCRLQSFLARAERESSGRSDFSSGPFVAGRLCALVPRRPHRRRSTRSVPHGSRGQGPRSVVVSASVADAGLLASADGVDGPRSAAGDLPSALHEVPRASRIDSEIRPQGLVLHRRRRIRRTRIARCDLPRRPREARQS